MVNLKSRFQTTPERGDKFTLRLALVVFASEFIGTFLLLFVGCCSTLPWNGVPVTNLQAGLAFGFTISAIIQVFGHISGAHINWTVTIAAWIFGKLSLPIALFYIVAQFVGAIAGYYLVIAVSPAEFISEPFCTTTVSSLLEGWQAFLIEFLASSFLILFCCASWDDHNKSNLPANSLMFGLFVSAVALFAGSYTGGSMNSVRSFAPALYHNQFEMHWVYWVAPISGAIFASILYMLVFEQRSKRKPSLESGK